MCGTPPDVILRVAKPVVGTLSATFLSDPVLVRFRAALDELYGDRLERVVLFGSRARGDARLDSDYDVAVFLRDLTDRWREIDRLAAIETDILAERDRSPLMHEVRREGIDL